MKQGMSRLRIGLVGCLERSSKMNWGTDILSGGGISLGAAERNNVMVGEGNRCTVKPRQQTG